jgi:hypothetical protein
VLVGRRHFGASFGVPRSSWNLSPWRSEPVPAEGLEVGDVGTVVHDYVDRKAFEVEFTTLDGKTTAVATVEALAVRPVTSHEITHSRELTRTG